MKRACFLAVLLLTMIPLTSSADEFNRIPRRWKWVSKTDVAFTYDGSFKDPQGFVFNTKKASVTQGVNCPEKFADFPVKPHGAVNLTFSPDSSKIAFTRDNDLYFVDIASGQETRLTYDGTDLILNGYASWVYYEEIFGRPSRYRAFWWSPDSKKLAYYRFDNTQVPLFPIYSPFGQDGSLNNTRYPKAGERNPEVRIAMVDVSRQICDAASASEATVWADFDSSQDQYFGTPFWGPDSREFFVSREPRTQNTLDLYSVSVNDGSKRVIYHESYPTWLDWIDGVIFTRSGLYMARAFETGWQQIYFLSYDGKTFERLTDGCNWGISLVAVDEARNEVYFTAKRTSTTRQALYKTGPFRQVLTLTDPAYNVSRVAMSPDLKYFVAAFDNARTPTKVGIFSTDRILVTEKMSAKSRAKAQNTNAERCRGRVIADMAGPDWDPSRYSLPQEVFIVTDDGFRLPGLMTVPKDLDTSAVARYPVHFEVYGGPDTPYVRDIWRMPDAKSNQWFPDNGIIHLTVDPRSAGHNGRAGEDMAYRQLTVYEIQDYVAWAKWITSFKYVNAAKLGVEGFSFGGTTTAMLLSQASEYFHYGIAGGGVYDWQLYDTHYTERFMDTPQNNPEGYKVACALNWISGYPTGFGDDSAVPAGPGAVPSCMLKLTHGTGDDNVHFQNTLQLIDVMQRSGRKFEFMIYPDGMHGYRGAQGAHSLASDHDFWTRYLLEK